MARHRTVLRYIFLLGYAVLGTFSETCIAGAMSVAAGAIMVMLVETMVPKAFEDRQSCTGPIEGLSF